MNNEHVLNQSGLYPVPNNKFASKKKNYYAKSSTNSHQVSLNPIMQNTHTSQKKKGTSKKKMGISVYNTREQIRNPASQTNYHHNDFYF